MRERRVRNKIEREDEIEKEVINKEREREERDNKIIYYFTTTAMVILKNNIYYSQLLKIFSIINLNKVVFESI